MLKLLQQKEKLATFSLMMGMFFLPFGYDALFKLILDWTHSYWITDATFYCLSGLFFMSYCYFSDINPLTALRDAMLSKLKKSEENNKQHTIKNVLHKNRRS